MSERGEDQEGKPAPNAQGGSAGEAVTEGGGAAVDTADAGAGARDLLLGSHLRIQPQEPISRLDRPTGQAFAAFDPRRPNRRVFAVVCDAETPPRVDAIPVFARLANLPVMAPIDWGTLDWPASGDERFVIAFEEPAGEPLIRRGANRLRAYREDELVKRLIEPMVLLLRELGSRGVAHRGICAENLYVTNSSTDIMTLGEGLTAPAGMLQPALYETITAAQAQPSGRGAGSPADDLYAFGVLLAILARGEYPSLAQDERAMIAAKIERGSYAAIVGRTRVSGGLMEPLRGLLADDPAERWGVSELEGWLTGRQMSPKQASIPKKARRSVRFAEVEYWTARSLAHAMACDWAGALELVRSGEVERWATRSLNDEKRSKAVSAVLASAAGTGPQGEDRRLGRLLIALDPAGPIRLRDFAARTEALPQALALNFKDDEQRRAYADSILGKLPHEWLNQQSDGGLDYANLAQAIERQHFFVSRAQPGYGLERVVHEYVDGWPCRSPLLDGAHVDSILNLLPALERRAARGDTTDLEPVDRHIAAFCAAKMKPSPERLLQALGPEDSEENRRRAMLRLLAELQRRYGPFSLPNLTGWVVALMDPILRSFNNRSLREDLERRSQDAVEQGSLPALVQILDNPETRTADQKAFDSAQREYRRLEHEIAWLNAGGLTSEQNVSRTSRSAATAISALTAGLMVMVVTVVYLA